MRRECLSCPIGEAYALAVIDRANVMLNALNKRDQVFIEALKKSEEQFIAEGGNVYDYEMDRWRKRNNLITVGRPPLMGALMALDILLSGQPSKFEWVNLDVPFDFSKTSTDSEQPENNGVINI